MLGNNLTRDLLDVSATLFDDAKECLVPGIEDDLRQEILTKNSELVEAVSGAVLHSNLRNLF